MTPPPDLPLPTNFPQPPSFHNTHHNSHDTTPDPSKSLTLTTHNTAKNIDKLEAIILQHMQNQTDILCLQEIPHAPNLSHLLNTHIYTNITNDHTNCTAIIIHSSLSPYTTTIKHDRVHGCVLAIDVSIPGYPKVRIINIYKSYLAHLRTRIEQTVSKLQHDQPHHVLLGDFNTYLQPLLDTEKVKHPKHWPWLHNQVHPPSHSTTPTLIDLYRKDHPEAKHRTRPANPRLHSQTHIDLILTSPAFHSNFKPFNTYIDSNNSTTDHRPVSTTIAIPNNPLNIYHIPQSTIQYHLLNKNEKSHLTSILQPLDTWVFNYDSTLSDLSLNDIVPITDFIFSQLVTAYKRVTLQAHAHKPTGIEKKINEQALKLNTQKRLNKRSLTTLQSLLNDWNIKKQSQNHKKLHYSLIHSKQITKTINNILHPRTTSPLSLYDTNGNLTWIPMLCANPWVNPSSPSEDHRPSTSTLPSLTR